MRVVWRTLRFFLLAMLAIAGVMAAGVAYALWLNRETIRLHDEGRYAEAIRAQQRLLWILEATLGRDNLFLTVQLNNLGELYYQQGHYSTAETHLKRALRIHETWSRPDDHHLAALLNHLALVYYDQGRYAEAERLHQRVVRILEEALGPEHSDLATALANIAQLMGRLGRHAEAEALYRRSLAITEKEQGADHPDVGATLSDLAGLYRDQRRYGEAEQHFERALRIREKSLGREHPDVGDTLYHFAALYQEQHRYEEAERLFQLSLSIREKSLGPLHPYTGHVLSELARLRTARGRYPEGESMLQRALGIADNALGPDHLDIVQILSDLGEIYLDQQEWSRAARTFQSASDVVIRRARRGTLHLGLPIIGRSKSEAHRLGFVFWLRIRTSHRMVEAQASGPSVASDMFQTAQWAQHSEAAASLAQMAVRQLRRDGPLAQVVRERQDLVEEWQGRDKLLVAAVSQPPDKRNGSTEQEHRRRLSAIDSRIAAIDKTLAKDFPEYAALAHPEPLLIAEVQAQLRPDEAFFLFLDTPGWQPLPEESFIWAITKTDARWVRIDLGTKALTERVRALRCGLDQERWGSGLAGDDPCFDALGMASYPTVVDGQRITFLPFDLARAHELYNALLGPFEEMIKGKHLLIVPSGPLTSLPFQVLVTEPPQTAIPRQPEGARDGAWLEPYRDAAWLGVRQPITVLPSVSSLKALREHAKASRASKAYLGIGNPLLDGKDPQAAQAAHTRQRCPVPATERPVLASRGRRSPTGFRKLFRGSQADIEQVRAEAPLPESAEELCEIGRRLGVPDSDILLGANATETAIKDLSERGRLAEHKVVQFATHGALSGQVKGFAEPGLILTPPDTGTTDAKALERDDGYLTASEVASLKLDADWVVLSACNTAGGQREGEGAEALSGLARAFFYAGARALLVSHWAVASDAAVKLTTGAFEAQKADPAIGRAEALRISMRSLIHNGSAIDAHPMMWAPFVVVGEGAN